MTASTPDHDTTDPIAKAHLTSIARERIRRRLLDGLDLIADNWHGACHPLGQEGSVRRPAPASKPPVPIDHTSALDACRRDLRSWGQLMLEEGGAQHGPRTTDGQPANGRQLARWLAVHVEWLAAHDAGHDAAEEIHRHGRRVRAIALGYRSRRFQVGRCPEVLDDLDGDGLMQSCTGGLWALVRQEDGMLPDRVVCDATDEHQWSPSQWGALGRRLGNLHPDGVERLLSRLGGYRVG